MFLKVLRFVYQLTFLLLLCVVPTRAEQTYTLYFPLVISPHVEPRHGAGSTYDKCSEMQALNLKWFYNWGASPPLCSGIEAVPMIWDERYIGRELGGNSEWLLGFNEPEMEGQANLAPSDAAEWWKILESEYPDRKLTTPCVQSFSWLTNWHDAFVGLYGRTPRVEAVCFHCYGAWTAQTSIAKCTYQSNAAIQWAQQHNIEEVWLSEFAHLPCWPEGDQGTIDFMNGMLNYFVETPEITRYAWFQTTYKGTEPWSFGPDCNTSLADYYSGQLTVFGEVYKNGIFER